MESTGSTLITWYGHACIELVTPGGKTVLFDPGSAIQPARAHRKPSTGVT